MNTLLHNFITVVQADQVHKQTHMKRYWFKGHSTMIVQTCMMPYIDTCTMSYNRLYIIRMVQHLGSLLLG